MLRARDRARPLASWSVAALVAALALLSSAPPAGGWGTLTGGLNLSSSEASNLRWLLGNYGVDPTTKVAEIAARAGAHPIHQFISYQAWLAVQGDPAIADGLSGLPPVEAINAWDGVERCEHGMMPAAHDLVNDPRLVPKIPGAGGPSPDAEVAATTPLAFNALYNGRAHYWSPWLQDGQAPTAAGANYSRLVQAVVEGQADDRRGHYAAYMGHYVTDPTSAKHGDTFTLDLATLQRLIPIATRFQAAASDDLPAWIAHESVTEGLALMRARAAALAPAVADAYWRRIAGRVGLSGPDALLLRQNFWKVEIVPSTLRTATACYLHELAAWKAQADAGGTKSLDAFYTFFDPLYFNGPLFDHWATAPDFGLCNAGSEHLTWETRPAQFATVQEWMPKAEPLIGGGDPHRHYLPLPQPAAVHDPDPERARLAREEVVADLVRRCADTAHGGLDDDRDFRPEHLEHMKMGIRCMMTALRASVTALRADAWGRRVGEGGRDVRIQLEVTNLAPKPAALLAADVYLRDPASGKLATAPGWRVSLGGRVVGAEPVSVGVLVRGVPPDVPPSRLVVDLRGDLPGIPDAGWRRVEVEDRGTLRVTNPSAGAALGGGRKGPIDVAVVMDTTGSMQSSIDSLRRNAIASIRTLRDHTDDIRMALTTFRDLGEEDDLPHFHVYPFTRDLEAQFAIMNDLRADGGGDVPEDQLHGISLAIRLWEAETPDPDRVPAKIIVVITDAPAKSPDSAGNTFESIARRAYEVDPAHVYPIIVGRDRRAIEHGERLAVDTTGRMLNASSGDDVAAALLDAVGAAAATHAVAPGAASGPPAWLLLTLGGLLLACAIGLALLARRRLRRGLAPGGAHG